MKGRREQHKQPPLAPAVTGTDNQRTVPGSDRSSLQPMSCPARSNWCRIGALTAVSASLALAACGHDTTVPLSATTSPSATTAPAPPPGDSPRPEPSPRPTLTSVATAPALEPLGYPLDPDLPTSRVTGQPGERRLVHGIGPSVRQYSRRGQPGADPDTANASGWNCRTHQEYEGQPAVDWYVPPSTPVRATMDGTATLYVNTVVNAFDFYRVPRGPYLGNPDRARAPVIPFPGPGGGMGVYVAIANDGFVTHYGHLHLSPTLSLVPAEAFLPPYSPAYDYARAFAEPRPLSDAIEIASWEVHKGDLIGYTGDSGYSEAPHLHYEIRRAGSPTKLCPTGEAGFSDGGWLEKQP